MDPSLETVVIVAPLRRPKSAQELQDLGRYCKELTIRIELEQRPTNTIHSERSRFSWRRGSSGSVTSEDRTARQVWDNMRRAMRASVSSEIQVPFASIPQAMLPAVQEVVSLEEQRASREPIINAWTDILGYFNSINTMTISVQDREPWPTMGIVEDTMVAIRVAMEAANLPYLQRFRFQPVHAMGIVTFRWHGFGAIARAPARAYKLWENIVNLDLQVDNPFDRMSESQSLTFLSLLYEYLSSFTPTIRRLRFIWLNNNGPSPLALQQEPGLAGTREMLRWTQLEEIWLGNVTSLGGVIAQAKEYCPKLGRMKSLRAPVRHDTRIFENADAWVEILLTAQTALPLPSRPAPQPNVAGTADTCRATSGMTLPFMLDAPPHSPPAPPSSRPGWI